MSFKNSKKILCIVIGGGGHAGVVIDCIKGLSDIHLFGVLDSNPALWGKEILGVSVLGGDELLTKIKTEGVTHFIPGVGGVKDNAPRMKVYEQGIKAGLIPLTVIHPTAVLSETVRVGGGTVIMPGAIVNTKTIIGANVIVNTGAIIDHDCVIGDHVHIAPGVTLSGEIKIGSRVHIGTGASIRQGVSIGDGSIVGVGSVVVKNVPAGVIVKGVPAK